MITAKSRHLSGPLLLCAAWIWLLSVSVCATRTLADEPHEHSSSSEHSHHDQGGDAQESSCGCETFNSLPGEAPAQAKLSFPTVSPFVHTTVAKLAALESPANTVSDRITGPPWRCSFAELILQRCRLSHAPPSVV